MHNDTATARPTTAVAMLLTATVFFPTAGCVRNTDTAHDNPTPTINAARALAPTDFQRTSADPEPETPYEPEPYEPEPEWPNDRPAHHLDAR